MKNFIAIQRLITLALAVVLIFSIGIYAFAEDTENPEATPTQTASSIPTEAPTELTPTPTPTETPIDPTPTSTPEITVPPVETTPTPTPTETPIDPAPTPTPEITESPVAPTETPTPTDAPTEPTPEPTEEIEPIDDVPEIPAPAYTLNIPANQIVSYKTESHDIGCPTVSDAFGFAAGKDIKLSISWTEFRSESTSTTIPFAMKFTSPSNESYDFTSGTVYFIGNDVGTVEEYPVDISISTGEHIPVACFMLKFNVVDWDNALPGEYNKAMTGEYKASITFSTEIMEQ